MVPFVR